MMVEAVSAIWKHSLSCILCICFLKIYKDVADNFIKPREKLVDGNKQENVIYKNRYL